MRFTNFIIIVLTHDSTIVIIIIITDRSEDPHKVEK